MMETRNVRPARAASVMLLLLAALWVLELADQASGNRLDNLGIHAQEVDGLPEIFSAPFLHAGWEHLIGNSVPFFVLGFLVLLGGFARWLWSSAISIIASGLTAWLLTPANTIILGASGLIFGWLTYLLARALWSAKVTQALIALVVLVVYGGMIWGVLPTTAGVSWQAHLGGAVGGIIAARVLHARSERPGPGARRLLRSGSKGSNRAGPTSPRPGSSGRTAWR